MGVLTTIEAECKDCYKCVRACPVKAIKVNTGHAQIWEERCILDGRCINVCPQAAKQVQDDLGKVKSLISSGKPVAVSLAPSHVVAFDLPDHNSLVAALKRLGFTWVEETAIGAEFVAYAHRAYVQNLSHPAITSSCPAVVNLIEKHFPAARDYLVPVVSPMIAHGRLLRQRYGSDIKVVFIGPCVAKKAEAAEEQFKGVIDAVLTFIELEEWFSEAGIDPQKLPGEAFDCSRTHWGRLFPLAGGLLRTAGLSTDMLAGRTATVTGIEKCQLMIRQILEQKVSLDLIEMMGCDGGCIDGPCMPEQDRVFTGHRDLMRYVRQRASDERKTMWPETVTGGGPGVKPGLGSDDTPPAGDLGSDLGGHGVRDAEAFTEYGQFKDRSDCRDGAGNESIKAPAGHSQLGDHLQAFNIHGPDIPAWLQRTYSDKQIRLPEPSEEDIRRILATTGKHSPSDELNCGACGYDSCREKARAVYQGVAESEMCIPYMRAKAESLAHLIMDSTPNGIIVVDENMTILALNPAAEEMFRCKAEDLVGRRLRQLLPEDAFQQVLQERQLLTLTKQYPDFGLITRQYLFTPEDQEVVVGIFTDITAEQRQKEELARIKSTTLERAQEVIDKQMRVAQEIAGLLGETTAETKVLLSKLMQLMRDDEE